MIPRSILFAALLACIVIATAPRPALGGACPSPQVRVFPGATVPAPTNVRVRLVFDAEEVTVHDVPDPKTRSIRKTGSVRAKNVRVALRDMQGKEARVSLHRPPATHNPILYVLPVAPLRPSTRYDVVLKTGAEEYVIDQITTGTLPATTPPTIGNIELAIYSAYPQARHWKDPSGRYIFVTLSAGSGATAYEVHELPGSAGPSDATLRSVLPGISVGKIILRLEERPSCGSGNFSFPKVSPSARSHPLRLGIRALDDAGNKSPVREVELDLTRPGRHVRPGKTRTR
ncbi:MAG: hypothetical protein RBU30_08340 [Polyangia bacterium]|jgi:hypothetical protein|nr:hypothetical protein [Polyangia bacterium]